MKKIKYLIHMAAYLTSVFSSIYMITITPGIHRKKKWQHLSGWNFAHRGLHDNRRGIPENSMKAFRCAVDHGFGIELDVHLTADNQLVVFHDDNLIRMCHSDQTINSLPLDSIRQFTLADTTEHIPLFKDVLDLVNGQVPLIIELKVDKSNQALLCPLVWQLLRNYHGDYCIESFHPLALQWFKKNHPSVIRGQLSCNFFKETPHCDIVLFLVSNLMTNFIARPDFIAYKYSDTRKLAYRINKKLFRLMTAVWTVPSEPAYHRFKHQADAIIFEGFLPPAARRV